MRGILYLLSRTAKNRIIDLKKHPGKLVAYIIIIALMGFVFVSSAMSDSSSMSSGNLRSMSELGAIILALFMFLFISQIMQGLSTGSTFFKMCDVNLLFVSPTSPNKILVYGLVRQMGMSLLMAVFILFQGAVLKNAYGVGIGGVLIIFLGYFVLTFVSSVVSIAIYSVTSGDEKKKTVVKGIIYLTIIPVIASILLNIKNGQIGIEAVVNGINSPWLEWIPFAGWIKAITYGGLIGEISNLLVYSIAILLSVVLLIIIIIKNNNNYYEDVLQATESMHTRMQNAKEGRVVETKDTKKIKLKHSGINHGKGASVFFFKHMLENKRAGKFFFDSITIFQIIFVIIFTLVVGKEAGIIFVFGMSTYMQLFTSFTGRWVRELKVNFIYLIPQNPLKKLLYSISEGILKCLFDGILIFVSAGIILKATPVEIIICIVARIGFGILFISGDVLSQRIFGEVTSKGLLLFLNILALIVIAIPGVIAAIVIGVITNIGTVSIMATFVWNVVISFIIIGLCRNILHNIEQNNV
ncbi:putative ABC exporter domain-containing protein [Clostridium sp.]|uniref:putative ABC exporter domain-containing protein n=1 Tax=Clostridium sp. TaxID=1506 RepID=UPI0032177817